MGELSHRIELRSLLARMQAIGRELDCHNRVEFRILSYHAENWEAIPFTSQRASKLVFKTLRALGDALGVIERMDAVRATPLQDQLKVLWVSFELLSDND